jgi:hypothetical protein
VLCDVDDAHVRIDCCAFQRGSRPVYHRGQFLLCCVFVHKHCTSRKTKKKKKIHHFKRFSDFQPRFRSLTQKNCFFFFFFFFFRRAVCTSLLAAQAACAALRMRWHVTRFKAHACWILCAAAPAVCRLLASATDGRAMCSAAAPQMLLVSSLLGALGRRVLRRAMAARRRAVATSSRRRRALAPRVRPRATRSVSSRVAATSATLVYSPPTPTGPRAARRAGRASARARARCSSRRPATAPNAPPLSEKRRPATSPRVLLTASLVRSLNGPIAMRRAAAVNGSAFAPFRHRAPMAVLRARR